MTVKELKEWAKKNGCTNIKYCRYRDERCHLIRTDTVVSYDAEIKDNYEIIDWAFDISADVIGVLMWDFYNGCPIEN